MRVAENRDHVFDVGLNGLATLTANRRPDLFVAPIFQLEELIRIAVLFVIVDQARVRR